MRNNPWPGARLRRTPKSKSKPARRQLSFELLEERQLLSVTPPTIEEVLVAGQAWRDAFVSKLAADGQGVGGYRLTTASAATPLPWSNLDRLSVRFNEGVNVQASDLRIQGVDSGIDHPLAANGFQYNASTFTATWTFASPLGADKYAIRLGDSITNTMGLALDGEGASRTGNGTAGGDFVFQFAVIPGDGNGDGVTNMHDGLGLRQRMFADPARADYLTRYDFDGSGVINIQDGLEFRDKLFSEVPTAPLDLDGPLLFAELARDTAAAALTDFDGVTSDSTLMGSVADQLGGVTLLAKVDGGTAVPVTVAADGTFNFSPPLAVDGSSDGNHVVQFIARDGFGNKSTFEVPFTLDTQGPAIGPLSLSAGSGFVTPTTSSAGRVTLLGASTPGLTVSLVGTGMSALVNNAGEFQFPSVPLALGNNTFIAAVTDGAGNTVQVPTVIQRVEIAAQQDPVLRWNQALLDAVQLDASAPTFASRAMALVHAAIYDAVSAIEGTAGYSVALAAPTGISLEAAVSGAAHRVLSYLYPAQQALFNTVRTAALGQVPDGADETGGVAFGQSVGEAIIALRADDGWDDFINYVPGTNPGDWQQTEPLYAPALDPQWANLPSFSGADLDELVPVGPPALSSLQWANALNEVKSLGSASSTVRTADQTQIARFWADGSGTVTPPGHWNKIAQQVAIAAGNSIAENARLFAKLDIALADAAILAWKAKFETDFWRPFTAIHNADLDGNDLTTADANWQPLLITPNFPEYVSGHSTFSGAAAAVLTSVFGANYSFTTTSSGLLNVNRTFASFDAAATEAGRSRIFGGIHYEFSNQDGQAAGRALAAQVLSTFDAAADVVAPKIIVETDSGGVTATNQAVVGRVLDNLSGVVALTASVDGGAAAPVTFDALGRFTFTTSLALNGVAEGEHTVSLTATDFQGNVSAPQVFDFTLDTLAPTVQIIAPEEGATLESGALLSGLANATGSSIVELKYAFTGQPARPIPFDSATGEFSVPLNIAALAPGATVLTVTVRDAAGHVSSVIRNLTVAQRATFGVERFTPLNGAQDVGSTYRPQVFFSRAVNPTSLNANNFYATGPNGAKLAANIVPAGDGSFAWLFFTQPMPSASQITVHVNGATILAAADGAALDADGNGTAGGELTFKFSTVSLTPLVGTSLTGKVVEAGPDLKPMTFDDIRVGPDQVLHTPDDVFLTPLAGVKVFIVGLEDQFVLTDAQGNFSFPSAPAGNVKLAIDGRTATNAPAGTFFPEMVMDLALEAGRANTVMGTMGTREQQIANRDRQEVYLPRLQTSILQNVGGAAPTTITVVPEAAANITPEQRALLTLTVPAGSMRDQNGNVVNSGQVGISTVPAALVREMLPPGLLQHTFDITIQSPGVTNFATPAPMTFPNLFGGKPGEQLNFLSFDHTTGRLVIEGSATVSADGLSVSTDPGTGITHPGWHGVAPPGSPTRPQPQTTDLVSSTGLLIYRLEGVTDHLLTDRQPFTSFDFSNTSSLANGARLRVVISVNSEYAHKYLDGLQSQDFDLNPGESKSVRFGFKSQDILGLNSDALVGVSYEVFLFRMDGIVATQLPSPPKSYIYRYFDNFDDNPSDDVLKFNDTFVDGTGGVVRNRPVMYAGDPLARPTLSFNSLPAGEVSHFNVTEVLVQPNESPLNVINFDPQFLQSGLSSTLLVTTPAPNPRLVEITDALPGNRYLRTIGTGLGTQVVYLNKADFVSEMKKLVADASPTNIVLEYNPALLNQTPTPTFKLSLPNLGGITTTRALPLGATADAVKTAMLEDLIVLGADEVDVDLDTINTPAKNGKPASRKDVYTITPKVRSLSPIEVISPSLGAKLKWREDRSFKFDLLTKDQVDYYSQTGNIEALFDNILADIRKYYVAVSASVIFSDAPAPDSFAYRVDWTLDKTDNTGETASFPTRAIEKVAAYLNTELKTLSPKPSAAQISFRIAQILSESRRDTQQHNGIVFLFDVFNPLAGSRFDVSPTDLKVLLASVIAHEVGHGMGLPHTAFSLSNRDVVEPEIQRITVTPNVPNFQVTYAGASTAQLPRLAPASQVRDNLLALPGFRGHDFDVTGAPGGPYTVNFSRLYNGVDVPTLSGTNVTVSQVSEGQLISQAFREMLVEGQRGRDDLMRATTSLDPRAFQSKISELWLRMSLGLNWDASQHKTVVATLLQFVRIKAEKNQDITPHPQPGQPIPEDPDGFEFEGSLLAVFNRDGLPADQSPLQFGELDESGSATTRTVTLENLGSEPVVVRGVGITKGIASFSTPVLPVTTLQPGESLEIEVTYHPVPGLAASGRLVIEADIPIFGGEIELQGSDRTASLPAISLSSSFNPLVPFYNNIGSYQVGEQLFRGAGFSPLLTNNGTAPLTITEIRVATGQGEEEYQVTPLAAPRVLAPGESLGIALRFRPSKVGLRPGAVEVLSNDPRTPVLRIPVVATGVNVTEDSLGQNVYLGADLGNDYTAVTNNLSLNSRSNVDNLPVLRTRSDDAGNWEFFLPAERYALAVTYDPVSGLVAASSGVTNATGINSFLNRGNFIPSIFPDTDGDGLPDDVEFAIGTNPNKVDTDGDGKNDFAELDGGFNPIDDRPAANGIVSALQTGATALDIKLAVDFLDPSRSIAYIASGGSGLTVVDVTDFARPITIAQLSMPGTVNNLSLDVGRKIIAAASPTSGVSLIDVSDPARPTLLRTLAHEGTDPVAAVELYDGLVYVAVGNKIRNFDAQSGEPNADLVIAGQRLLGMSRSGDYLYVTARDTTTNQYSLRTVEITATGLVARGAVNVPNVTTLGDPYMTNGFDGRRDIVVQTPVGPIIETVFVKIDVAWIPAGDRIITVDVSNRPSPQIIDSTYTIAQGGATDIELNGSGLAVVAGVVNPGGSAIVLRTFYLNEPNQIFNRYTLPSFGEAVALSSGLAYIADGASGLQLVNFLQRDTGLVPPTVSINPILGDLDPGQSGVQLFEGSTVTVGNQITDDVQVQRVELLADGQVVRTELSYPYDLTTVLPTIAQTGNQVVLQVRATDTGGNITLLPPQVIDLVADTTAPTVTLLDPPNGSTQTLARRKVTLQFSEAISAASAIAANFVLQGPGGPVTPLSIDLRQRDTRIEILYPPPAEGAHTFTTHAAQVKDRAGNALGTADVVSTFTIAPAVRQPTIRWVNDAGGQWNTASNWIDVVTNAARVPTTTDDVLIDVPTDALITFGTGVVTVNSILSNERFSQTGGTLTVTDTMQVNNTFRLGIDQVFSNNIPTFKGTLLRGTGGQGLTLVGESRLDTATIQTDITTTQANTQVRLTGGLALTGTFTGPTAANTNVQIGLEGSQTISSGTFISAEAANNAGVIQFMSMSAGNTITLGQDVTLRGQIRVLSGGFYRPPSGVTTTLNVINHGTMKVGGQPDTSNFGIVLTTGADSFINHGLLESQGAGSLVLNAKSFTNSATGRIKIEQPVGSSQLIESLGAGGTTTSFVNAGSIQLINASATILSRADGVNETFINTGTITNDKSSLRILGKYTTADVANIPNTGYVFSDGVQDNTGRTFSYSNTVGVFMLRGRTLGGTIVKVGAAELFVLGVVGVTLEGDFSSSESYNDPITGNRLPRGMGMQVEQGLTLRGTISFYKGLGSMTFIGPAQTVSGGTFQFFPSVNGSLDVVAIRAISGETVTFDSTVTIRSNSGSNDSLLGKIISNANIIVGANSTVTLSGIQPVSGPVVAFANRGTVTVPATGRLNAARPFTNEGQIVVNGGTMFVTVPSNSIVSPYLNTGTINLTGGGVLGIGNAQNQTTPYRTADLGTIIDSGGFVQIGNYTIIDNTGATLVIDGTANWSLTGSELGPAQIIGGTIQVESTAKFDVFNGGVLKDVIVNGNVSSDTSGYLVGEVDINGTYTTQRTLNFGHPTLYPNTPLVIRGGEFQLAYSSVIAGYSTVTAITLDPDVVLRSKKTTATFAQPLTNKGQIIIDPILGVSSESDRLFHFTAAPITNEGTLSAINRGILRINNLAAPSSGVVSATVEARVEFTGAFAQTAAGTTRLEIGGTGSTFFGLRFGSVNVGGAATLAGKLDVQFASGYTPTVGSRYQVMNYASRTGQFDMLTVTGLASGLVVTPEYNGTNLTLVVSSASSLVASVAMGAVPTSAASSSSAAIATALEEWAGPGEDAALLLAAESTASRQPEFRVSDFDELWPTDADADDSARDEVFGELALPKCFTPAF